VFLLEGPSLFLLLLFLVPVTCYCLALAVLNRRSHPTMVTGSWDFLGLLFAASGFLLFAAPRLLNGLFERILRDMTFADEGPSRDAVGAVISLQLVTWVLYYVLVIGGGVLLAWLRRGKTVVYNVAPEELERALERALARQGLTFTRAGGRLVIGAAQAEPAEDLLSAVSAAPLNGPVNPARATSSAGEAVVDVEPFPVMWNATLHWRSDPGELRGPVETQLARELREVPSYDNPVGTWLLGVAGFLFALVFMIVMALVLGAFFPRR
jgi:hypothetical protein